MAFCWCGKKTDFESVAKRTDIEKTKAWNNKRLIELDPTIFLQPGPAIILEGIDRAKREIEKLISSG